MHKNIPIFIPHLGCPHQCVFCNQRSISGCEALDEREVDGQIHRALETIDPRAEVEIAFFGGSFTAIDRGLMIRLLDTAQKYVNAGRVHAIRLSTRPDYIDDEVLEILSRYAVRTIELGLQSMDDAVLRASGRGHDAKTAREACRRVRESGFSRVGQMMIGLPASSPEAEMQTAEEICRMGADAARIYPTVVFYETPLCEMTQAGQYRPLDMREAVERSARVLEILERGGVPCIRIGLCATESLVSDDAVLAGPNHPALGELVWNEFYYARVREAIDAADLAGQRIALSVPRGETSKVIGQRRSNAKRLLDERGVQIVRVTDCLAHGEIRAEMLGDA